MWWRIWVPTWRFFDVVGSHPELLIKVDGHWRNAIPRPRPHWYSLSFNPEVNYYHACNNLLERLIGEISDGAAPETLVSFALVRDLANGREFKVNVEGEDVLHSQGTST